MNFKKYHLIEITLFVIIVAVAIITRFYKLGEIPKGFYVDEAGQGYSAYSLLKTGKDEFGKSFPIVFRSLTDFKTPVYIYLIIPLIPLFNLTAFTVRFPSFILSILTLPVLFLLLEEFLKDKGNPLFLNKWLPYFVILLLAVSPWHILFGRTNFECNVALFFYLSGALFFFKSLKKPHFLILSSILFAIAIPAYHSHRIITPLTLIALFIKYKNVLLDKEHFKYLFFSLLIAFFILLPTILIAFTPGFLARASGLNIFTHAKQMPDGFLYNYHGIFAVINSSWYLSTREFFSLYFSYLSPRYMFYLGDYGMRSSFPELATFFIWQAPFYLYGLWILITKKFNSNFNFFVLLMLLVSPIPAALTRDPYTTIRSLPLVIPQIIITSLGVLEIFAKLKTRFFKAAGSLLFSLVIIYSLFKLYSSVAILNEYYRANAWDYGWESVTDQIKKLDNTLPIVVDNARSDSDLILSFFLKYDPHKYQSENVEVPLNEYYTNLYRNRQKHIGQIITRSIDWQKDLIINQYLIADGLGISDEQIKEHKLSLIKQINYPDGTVAYRIVQTNPKYELEQKLLFSSRK